MKRAGKRKRTLHSALPYLTIALSVLLAWLPALTKYVALADDYLDLSMLKNGLSGWYQTWGIWRIWGIPLSIWSINFHPLAPGLLVVTAHVLAVCLFYKTCVLFFGSAQLSLVLALLMGIFPWGYEALLWSAAQSPVLAHPLFWANIIILVHYARRPPARQKTAFTISFILTFAGALGNDYLIFSSMMSGAIVWLPENGLRAAAIKRRMISHFSGWAPVVASLSYIVLWKLLSESKVENYKHPFFNLRSIFSTYYYQYTNAWVFQPWTSAVTRRLIFFEWGWQHTLAAVLLTLALGAAMLFVFRGQALNENADNRVKANLLPYIILLLLGGSLVYAVSGGYSLDSRKKYSLIPLILLFTGWAWTRFVRPFWKKPALGWALGCALIVAGTSTTWLVIGVWRYEVRRHDELVSYLHADNISGDIQLISDPDVYAAWPSLRETIGFRLDDDWVLSNALTYRRGGILRVGQGSDLVRVGNASAATVLQFDPQRFRWERASR